MTTPHAARMRVVGPDMLAVQIEERRAELAFLRTVQPRRPTQPEAGVAPETAARTDDGKLGEVGPRGLGRSPMADTDMTGTVAYEVRGAGASDAEGCGMDASNDFEVFERTAASGLGAHGMVTGGPGEAAKGGGGYASAHAAAARACATGGAAVGSGGEAGAAVADKDAPPDQSRHGSAPLLPPPMT